MLSNNVSNAHEPLKKITQEQWNQLWSAEQQERKFYTLDEVPAFSQDTRHAYPRFRIGKLLEKNGFKPDLSWLKVYVVYATDFSGVNLTGAALSGKSIAMVWPINDYLGGIRLSPSIEKEVTDSRNFFQVKIDKNEGKQSAKSARNKREYILKQNASRTSQVRITSIFQSSVDEKKGEWNERKEEKENKAISVQSEVKVAAKTSSSSSSSSSSSLVLQALGDNPRKRKLAQSERIQEDEDRIEQFSQSQKEVQNRKPEEIEDWKEEGGKKKARVEDDPIATFDSQEKENKKDEKHSRSEMDQKHVQKAQKSVKSPIYHSTVLTQTMGLFRPAVSPKKPPKKRTTRRRLFSLRNQATLLSSQQDPGRLILRLPS